MPKRLQGRRLIDLSETEADVAAEFAHQIKSDGRLRVHMEVLAPSSIHRSGTFRIDAVITDLSDSVICAVEFKAGWRLPPPESGRQKQAYRGLGFPFFYCHGVASIRRVVSNVFAIWSGGVEGLEERN